MSDGPQRRSFTGPRIWGLLLLAAGIAVLVATTTIRSPEGYAELGQGVIDIRPLLPILDRVNYSGWLMAELDEAKRPAREAATLSRDYFANTLGLKLG